jgi:hypothetical protein
MTWRPEGDFGVLAEFPPSFMVTKRVVETIIDGIYERRTAAQDAHVDMELIVLAISPGALTDLVLTLTDGCILN